MLEAPSSTLALRNRLRLSQPGSYYFGAGGGLGFGLAAAVGVQLAAAGPAGRLRARRGLGAVRDHARSGPRSPTRCRSRSSCCATGVRDPQVVRGARAGRGRAGARPAGARRAAVAPRLRGRRRARSTTPRASCARRWARRSRSGRPRARRGPGRARDVALLEPKTERLAPEASAASPDAAPGWVAAGTPGAAALAS